MKEVDRLPSNERETIERGGGGDVSLSTCKKNVRSVIV